MHFLCNVGRRITDLFFFWARVHIACWWCVNSKQCQLIVSVDVIPKCRMHQSRQHPRIKLQMDKFPCTILARFYFIVENTNAGTQTSIFGLTTDFAEWLLKCRLNCSAELSHAAELLSRTIDNHPKGLLRPKISGSCEFLLVIGFFLWPLVPLANALKRNTINK